MNTHIFNPADDTFQGLLIYLNIIICVYYICVIYWHTYLLVIYGNPTLEKLHHLYFNFLHVLIKALAVLILTSLLFAQLHFQLI